MYVEFKLDRKNYKQKEIIQDRKIERKKKEGSAFLISWKFSSCWSFPKFVYQRQLIRVEGQKWRRHRSIQSRSIHLESRLSSLDSFRLPTSVSCLELSHATGPAIQCQQSICSVSMTISLLLLPLLLLALALAATVTTTNCRSSFFFHTKKEKAEIWSERFKRWFRFLGEVDADQCDQMIRIFFNIWPFATMQICPILS